MAAFGIHELRKQTPEEFPDADYGEVFGRTRDKVVSAVKDANIGERVGEQASKLRLPEARRRAAARHAGERGADRGSRATRTRACSASSDSPSCARKASSPTRSSPPRRRGCWRRLRLVTEKPAAGFEPATS